MTINPMMQEYINQINPTRQRSVAVNNVRGIPIAEYATNNTRITSNNKLRNEIRLLQTKRLKNALDQYQNLSLPVKRILNENNESKAIRRRSVQNPTPRKTTKSNLRSRERRSVGKPATPYNKFGMRIPIQEYVSPERKSPRLSPRPRTRKSATEPQYIISL